MEATKEQYQKLPGATGIDQPEALEQLLANAKQHVIRCGVAVSHATFAELQLYWTAHLAEIGQNPVQSQSIADVRVTYSNQQNKNNWYRRFHTLKTQIQGFAGRF